MGERLLGFLLAGDGGVRPACRDKLHPRGDRLRSHLLHRSLPGNHAGLCCLLPSGISGPGEEGACPHRPGPRGLRGKHRVPRLPGGGPPGRRPQSRPDTRAPGLHEPASGDGNGGGSPKVPHSDPLRHAARGLRQGDRRRGRVPRRPVQLWNDGIALRPSGHEAPEPVENSRVLGSHARGHLHPKPHPLVSGRQVEEVQEV
mmetsp:Transcript_7506/g.13922  ORF Transcript_7506/g.13922 Transcript_7506/m.13922 type:complete len:201 (-) Transcript_7506:259-861(-)